MKYIAFTLVTSVGLAGPILADDIRPDTKGWFSSPYIIEQTGGETVYRSVCAACHMPEGQGAVGAGMYPALAGNPNLEFPDYAIDVVLNGLRAMPPFGDSLSDRQIADVVTYIQTSFGNTFTDEPATRRMVAEYR